MQNIFWANSCVLHWTTTQKPRLRFWIQNHFMVPSDADSEEWRRCFRAHPDKTRSRFSLRSKLFMCVVRGMPSTGKSPSELHVFLQMVGFSRWKWMHGLSPSPSLATLSWLAALESLKTRLNKQTGLEGNSKELHENLGKESQLVPWKMSCCVQSREFDVLACSKKKKSHS